MRCVWLPLCVLAVPGCEKTRPMEAAQHVAPVTGSLAQLLASTPVVVHLRVTVATGRDGTMGRAQVPAIYTDLQVTELHRVLGSARLDGLTVLGGEVQDRAHLLSDQVRLDAGDEIIAFLDPSKTPHPFIGGTSGILRVIDGRVFSYERRPLVAVMADGFVLADTSAPDDARLPVGRGTATGHPVRVNGTAMTVEAVLAELTRWSAR